MANSTSGGEQSKVFRAVETFGNICLLNVLFILSSIPIITFGAAVTATYSVSLKMVKNEEGAIFNSYKKAFKENFKKATILWLIVIFALAVLYAEYLFVNYYTDTLAKVYLIIMIIEIVLFLLVIAFIFPLTAKYENTVMNTITNAMLLSVSNPWSFIKIVLIWVMPIFLLLYDPAVLILTWYIWIIFMFGLIFYCSSITINKVFKKIEKVQGAKAKDSEDQEDDENEDDGEVKKSSKKKKDENRHISTDGSLKNHLYHK